ncbi:3-ketoacyl-ACP reductase [Niastella yeongjuensis]|uniref:3-ketoacyl-ACP reductase n=1 Tax=Niastella yeongjuensis TaxID=354355 RepID=A0A1V9F785_9BACT|nr:SDR family oxidoreductase [Niastella yeongjuensis]OQP54269.1 3-ketoacyl-ACP reductase [Niastella yeongjuensis]SEP31039.1 3-oxoacyl-[acyl-carrier protein] reductase [Niastella yeongjuensis]
MNRLNNKVVLITGASKGIGAATAQLIAAEGAKVIINYAGSQAAAEKTVQEIKDKGGDAIAVKADVSKAAEVTALFDTAIAHYGKIDVLINNAGVMIMKLLKDTTDEDFDRQFNTNVRGTFNTMREAATRLADGGTIINTSSTLTRAMVPTYGTYVASKGAVEQLTRVFAKEMGSRGITVNAVLPGPTNTELYMEGKSPEMIARQAALNAFNRLAEVGDIAPVIVFLASDDAKWISGQTIGVNGAMA